MGKGGILGLVSVVLVIGAFCVFGNKEKDGLSFLSLEQSEFESYLQVFGKSYSGEEYFRRFSIYSRNMGFIRVFNSQGESWVLGQTQYTDWTVTEFELILTSSSSTSSNINPPTILPDQHSSLSYPQTLDWRTQGVVTPVENQGNCNSGWAFSAAGAIEGVWALAGNTLVSLSEQQLLDCSSRYGNNGCNGGTMDYAFNYVINSGIASESNYPYKAQVGTCQSGVTPTANIQSFTDVVPNSPTDLYNAVALRPVSVAVDADPSIWQNYKGGVISRNCGNNLNHAALVVGYNSISTPPYWILKNSFGVNWGESGYIRLAVVNGDGVCGVQKQPSYPNV